MRAVAPAPRQPDRTPRPAGPVRRQPLPEADERDARGLLHDEPASVLDGPVQRKAVVGPPDDPLEREADRAADRVARGEAAPPLSRLGTGAVRRCAACGSADCDCGAEDDVLQRRPLDDEEEEPVQARLIQRQPVETEDAEPIPRRRTGAVSGPGVTEAATRTVQSPAPGAPLHPEARARLEAGFGVDLGEVRVHEDAAAHRSADALRAQAFAHDRHIWLGRGASQADLHLMAHETAHVLQQDGLVRRQSVPTIEARTFDELWDAFDAARRGGRDAEARGLVPDLLVRMEFDDALEYAAPLAFWLLDQGDTSGADRALENLESAWWIRFVEQVGPGVPEAGLGSFGAPAGPEMLIARAETEGTAGNDDLALRLFEMAGLFLEMQAHQLAEEEARIAEDLGELAGAGMIGVLSAMQWMGLEEKDRRIRNYYPRRAAEALDAGAPEEARRLAALGDRLLRTLDAQSLGAPVVAGPAPQPGGDPSPPSPTATPESASTGSLPAADPEALTMPDLEVSGSPEADSAETPPVPRPRAATQILNVPPPFQGATIAQLQGNNYYFARSDRHAVTGDLETAFGMATTLFGVSGAVIAQRLGSGELQFVVAGMDPAFSFSDIRRRTVEGRPDLVGASGTVWPQAGDDHVVRAVLTTNGEATFVPGGELIRNDQEALLQALNDERRLDAASGRGALPVQLIQDEVFAPIDALIASGADDDREAAADQLAHLNATAFAVLSWEQRAAYLEALVEAWTWHPQERAIVEILKTVETRSQLDATIARLQEAGVWSQLIDDVDHELWSLFVAVGKNLGDPAPITAARIGSLLLEARLIRPMPGIAIGPDGPEISVNALAEAEQAALAFVRFLESTADAIVMLVTQPDKIVEGVAQLVKMSVMWKLADLGWPPAIEYRDRILGQVGQQVIWGFRGAELLRDRLEQVASRLQWTIIWEIASLFIGVGEIRAVLKGVSLGEQAAAFARFIRMLGLVGRVAESEAVVSQLTKLARILRRSSQVLSTEDEVIRLLSHLPEEDAARLGRALEGVDLDDTADLARLVASHPELGALAQRSLREIDAMGLLAAKAGGLSDEVVRAYRHLRGRGLSADTVADITRLVPDDEGARFARAVRGLEEVEGVSEAVVRQIAGRTSRMDAVLDLGGPVYTAAYRRATGDAATVDGVVQALTNRRATMSADDFQVLLDDLASGNSVRWRRFLEPETGLRQQADGTTHGLLTSGSAPYTWDATARRYTRSAHGGSTEVVEVYGDGRVRFWREQSGGTLTDEAIQYSITTHGAQPSPRGGTTLQSNHGIQDAWVHEHFDGTVGSDDVPAILITDSRTGSQHQAITSAQATEAAQRAASRTGPWDATYWDMRDALIRHHQTAGVPQSYIDRLVAESDRVFLPFRNDPAFAHLFPPQTP